jgi:hypothetical protein
VNFVTTRILRDSLGINQGTREHRLQTMAEINNRRTVLSKEEEMKQVPAKEISVV